LFTIFYYFLKQ